MKNIVIERLTLENFKCHKALTLTPAGENTSIYGDNASGKTSVYDALVWLLFGRDSHGNGEKNIEIKPLNEFGEVADHDAETSVEVTFSVDGELITLRRTYREVWAVKRGVGEASFEGNTSEYYIDGVPVKKFVFSDKVDELVDEDTFLLLTSVDHFAEGISWQERRRVLFDVAGVLSDDEIIAREAKFLPLAEGKGKLGVDDYKKKLLAEKKGFLGAKSEIPARISECEKTISDISGLDFDGARASLAVLSAKSEKISAEILAIEHDSAIEKKQTELLEVKNSLSLLERENALHIASQKGNGPDPAALLKEASYLEEQKKRKLVSLASLEAACHGYEREIEGARGRWCAVSDEEFTPKKCPTCGQSLPSDQIEVAAAEFEAKKALRLREIEQTANANKASLASAKESIERLGEEIAEIDTRSKELKAKAEALEKDEVEAVDMPGYAEKRAELTIKSDVLKREIADLSISGGKVKNKLSGELAEVKKEMSALGELIGKEALLAYSSARVDELREDAKNAAAALEAIEGMLFLIDEFSRYKAKFIEESINSHFKLARFRLFRERVNGGIEDRCDVVYDGVPYMGLNTGAKINVGIDIINTLSKAYGVSVPLFIDNAESVTRLEKSGGQMIRLVVSENDKTLRCEYEN